MPFDNTPHRSAVDGFVLVHRTLIETAQQLATVLHRTSDGREMAGLARVWNLYRAGLAEHHEGETDVVFPLVAARDPEFAELESSMARDHAVLDALLDVADRAIAVAVADRTAASRRAAADALDALSSSLRDHLEREERLVVPRVVAVISAEEMQEIERGLLRRIGAGRIAMTVAALDRTARRERIPMPPLPWPARVALPMWRRRSTRLLTAAGIEVGGAP